MYTKDYLMEAYDLDLDAIQRKIQTTRSWGTETKAEDVHIAVSFEPDSFALTTFGDQEVHEGIPVGAVASHTLPGLPDGTYTVYACPSRSPELENDIRNVKPIFSSVDLTSAEIESLLPLARRLLDVEPSDYSMRSFTADEISLSETYINKLLVDYIARTPVYNIFDTPYVIEGPSGVSSELNVLLEHAEIFAMKIRSLRCRDVPVEDHVRFLSEWNIPPQSRVLNATDAQGTLHFAVLDNYDLPSFPNELCTIMEQVRYLVDRNNPAELVKEEILLLRRFLSITEEDLYGKYGLMPFDDDDFLEAERYAKSMRFSAAKAVKDNAVSPFGVALVTAIAVVFICGIFFW